MKLLKNEQQKSNENSKIFYICQKKLKINMWKIKKSHKFRDHCYYTREYRGTTYYWNKKNIAKTLATLQ